jgi:hypothetical protein
LVRERSDDPGDTREVVNLAELLLLAVIAVGALKNEGGETFSDITLTTPYFGGTLTVTSNKPIDSWYWGIRSISSE